MDYDKMPRAELIAELKAWEAKTEERIKKNTEKENKALAKAAMELNAKAATLVINDVRDEIARYRKGIKDISTVWQRFFDPTKFWSIEWHLKELEKEWRKIGKGN